MKSFFGGNPNMAHWSVSVYRSWKASSLAESKAESERVRAAQQVLKDAGVKPTQYFQFKVKDEAGKQAMKAKAQAEASRIEALTGVKMEVAEGCFL